MMNHGKSKKHLTRNAIEWMTLLVLGKMNVHTYTYYIIVYTRHIQTEKETFKNKNWDFLGFFYRKCRHLRFWKALGLVIVNTLLTMMSSIKSKLNSRVILKDLIVIPLLFAFFGWREHFTNFLIVVFQAIEECT